MKRVLFISTDFNGYYREIISEFQKIGYDVDWYDDRPSNTLISKAIIRLNRNLLKRKIKKYSKKIIQKSMNYKYDLVFVILGQSFDYDFFNKLKLIHPESKFIYYLWDSTSNFPCIVSNYPAFDKVYSFDKYDCEKYGFTFKPLFYINQFDLKSIIQNNKYDYSYIGTIKPGRFSLIKSIINQLECIGYKGIDYFYLHSKFVFFYYKRKYKTEFKNSDRKKIHYNTLSKKECFDIIKDSRIVIDAPQPMQIGLTIRIFEALGMNKKIITTNADIKNYDFYNPKNIYILKDGKIDIDDAFFKSDFEMIDRTIKNNYSISNWLKKIIE